MKYSNSHIVFKSPIKVIISQHKLMFRMWKNLILYARRTTKVIFSYKSISAPTWKVKFLMQNLKLWVVFLSFLKIDLSLLLSCLTKYQLYFSFVKINFVAIFHFTLYSRFLYVRQNKIEIMRHFWTYRKMGVCDAFFLMLTTNLTDSYVSYCDTVLFDKEWWFKGFSSLSF